MTTATKSNVATVLVVDDDVLLARVFAQALASDGFRVHVSHGAEDALRQIQTDPPDAIIVDFRMPLINGAGFLYRLRERPAYRDIPVMMITGDISVTVEPAELQELGAELHFKPLSYDDLLAATHQLLTRKPAASS